MALIWTASLQTIDWQELSALYKAAPLGDKSPERLRIAFGNSMFRCFVLEEGHVIGAGRALADGTDCAYICDVAVLPSHQGRGLGRDIVEQLLLQAKGHRKIILYSVPGKEAFYRKLGFARMRTAMAIFENQEEQFSRGYLERE